MNTLIDLRDKFKYIYMKYEAYLQPLIKFLLASFAFGTLNAKLGYMERLKNPFVFVILVLLSSILPINATVIIAAVCMILHLYAFSLEAAVVGAVLLLIMLILFFSFDSKGGYILILTPLALAFNIPCAIPLIFGLLSTPFSIIPVGCGVLLFYFLHFIKAESVYIISDKSGDIFAKLQYILDGIVNNQDMFIMLVAIVTVLIVVYIIRKLSVDYAWKIAIGSGVATYLLITFTGSLAMGSLDNALIIILGTIISTLLAFLVQFFSFSLDYNRKEELQFEDDEYIYYVKAVPKTGEPIVIEEEAEDEPEIKPKKKIAKKTENNKEKPPSKSIEKQNAVKKQSGKKKTEKKAVKNKLDSNVSSDELAVNMKSLKIAEEIEPKLNAFEEEGAFSFMPEPAPVQEKSANEQGKMTDQMLESILKKNTMPMGEDFAKELEKAVAAQETQAIVGWETKKEEPAQEKDTVITPVQDKPAGAEEHGQDWKTEFTPEELEDFKDLL